MLKARPWREVKGVGLSVISKIFYVAFSLLLDVQAEPSVKSVVYLFIYYKKKQQQQQQRVQTNGPKLLTCLVPVRLLSRPIRSTHFEGASETNTRSDHVTRKA